MLGHGTGELRMGVLSWRGKALQLPHLRFCAAQTFPDDLGLQCCALVNGKKFHIFSKAGLALLIDHQHEFKRHGSWPLLARCRLEISW